MTKTIEELEADVKAAETAVKVAQEKHRKAALALRDARTAASGIHDHVLEGVPRYGSKSVRMRVGYLAPTSYRGQVAVGYTIRKDGTFGARQCEMVVSEASDLGLYADVYPSKP